VLRRDQSELKERAEPLRRTHPPIGAMTSGKRLGGGYRPLGPGRSALGPGRSALGPGRSALGPRGGSCRIGLIATLTTDAPNKSLDRTSAVESRLSQRRLAGAVGAIAFSGFFALWLGLRIGGTEPVRDFDDIATALAALAAALSCMRAAIRQHDRSRRFWSLLAMACGAWTFAEVVWAVYDIVLRVPVPVPSWADLGYLGAIPLAAAALLSHPAVRRARQARARASLDAVLLATALLFISWSFVLGPLWRHSDLGSLGCVVAIAYPFGDIVMLFLVVTVIRPVRVADRFGMWCVLAGIVAMAISDSTYTGLVEAGKYSSGDMVDVGWVVAYLCLALGAFGTGGTPAGRPARRPSQARQATGAPGVMPLSSTVASFVPILAALVSVAVEHALGRKLPPFDWALALALTLLALARQGLGLWDGWPGRPPATSRSPAASRSTAGSRSTAPSLSPFGKGPAEP